jgi:photosystem II stability/assembly factor-like uncharacterized protein
MKMRVLILLICVLTAILSSAFFRSTGHRESPLEHRDSHPTEDGDKGFTPSDWFFAQRAYPSGEVNLAAYRHAAEQAIEMRKRVPAQLSGLTWIQSGPTNIGGRITDLATDPRDRNIIYAASASGGVLKSTDGGARWTPLFDEQPALSIGALAIDPSTPEILYVGTGEANAGGGSVTYGGLGVFKTTDGGSTWNNIGLEETRYIGRIVVDPSNPSRVFVAAVGTLFSTNSGRGVYRTTDAGTSWELVLSVSDSTGAVDVIQNPVSTNILYASMWERIRRPDHRSYGGATSGIYKTTDGGDSWTLLTGGLPSGASVGRIGLSLSEANPEIVYAIFADDIGYFAGLYRSTDAGENWDRVNDGALESGYFYFSYGWWFGFIKADPTDSDILYAHGVGLYKTTDAGDSWFDIGSDIHVDHHAQAIDPLDHEWTVEGNDGGVYFSTNGGGSWTKSLDLPITQFYTNEIDYMNPQRLYGGTQDNGTIRTWTGETNGWEEIYGGDGFYVLVDPANGNTIYAESQYGGLSRSTNAGSTWSNALNGIDSEDRRNWCTPVVMDPLDPRTLYYGTHRVYRTTNGADSWTAISDDLTDGPAGGNLVFNTITTMAVAPSDPSVLYVGTDDGNVHVTFDAGQSWQDIGEGLPERWVTRVAVDPYDFLRAYVTISGFRWDSPLPHIYATTDGGANWTVKSEGLPEAPVNDIVIDPLSTEHLYVATDVGVFASTDEGLQWESLGEGLPLVPVTDLVFHAPTRTLAAATYGRSMFTVILPPPTGVESDGDPRIPKILSLDQNFPNPFNPTTNIRFTLPERERVDLRIFDVRGRSVRHLVGDVLPPGDHGVIWDGRDDARNPVPSGIYLSRLVAGGETATRKMLLLK